MDEVIKVFSFTKLWIVFEIVAEKFKPHFEGEKYETVKKEYSLVMCIESKRWSIKEWMWPSGEYNGHNTNTPM